MARRLQARAALRGWTGVERILRAVATALCCVVSLFRCDLSETAFSLVPSRDQDRGEVSPFRGKTKGVTTGIVPAFIPPETLAEIEEPAALNAIKSLQKEFLQVPFPLYKYTKQGWEDPKANKVIDYEKLTNPQSIRITYTGKETKYTKEQSVLEATFIRTSAPPSELAPPIVLLHGFDSSCLEFRRLMPELEEMGVEAYALDLLGWGFTDTGNMMSVGVEAKREHLFAFLQTMLPARPAVLVGVSLGAAVVVDFYSEYPFFVAGAVLVDPQGFIDGTPGVPRKLAGAGISVLGSWPLRSLANQLAYFDKETFATDDAIRVGRLHTLRPRWQQDSEAWLLGGGYNVSSKVRLLNPKPVLVAWGRQDEILPASEYLPKFLKALPKAMFRWIDDCGHSPHLEQPKKLAELIYAFLFEEDVPGPDASGYLPEPSPIDKLKDALR